MYSRPVRKIGTLNGMMDRKRIFRWLGHILYPINRGMLRYLMINIPVLWLSQNAASIVRNIYTQISQMQFNSNYASSLFEGSTKNIVRSLS